MPQDVKQNEGERGRGPWRNATVLAYELEQGNYESLDKILLRRVMAACQRALQFVPDQPKNDGGAGGASTDVLDGVVLEVGEKLANVEFTTRFEAARAKFSNTFERANWEALSPEEKKDAEALTASLVKDATVYHMPSSKPHRVAERAGEEHKDFEILGGSKEKIEQIQMALEKKLSDDMKIALTIGDCEDNVVQIISDPTSTGGMILVCRMFNPPRTSPMDNRSVHNRFVIAIKNGSKSIDMLGKNPRCLSYALRYAAVLINEEALVYVDVPLEGSNDTLSIVDQAEKRVRRFKTDKPSTHPYQEAVKESDKELAQFTQRVGINSGKVSFGGWRGLR